MSGAPPDPLDVVVDTGAPEAEMSAVADVFRRAGISASVRDDYMRLSADVLPWIVTFIAPITWVAAKFAGGFVEKAGEDAWDSFRAGGWRGLVLMVGELSRARGCREGTTTIEDPTGPDVHLTMAVPEDAYRELGSLDWAAMHDGWLSWNPSTQEWSFLHAHRAPRGVSAPRTPQQHQDDALHGA